MSVDWREHIVSTTDILRGKPCVKGTRIPVSLILGYLATGHTAEEIMAELPDLGKEQIAACLDEAERRCQEHRAGRVPGKLANQAFEEAVKRLR